MIPNAEKDRIADLIYGTGSLTATFYWTNGLTYSTTTTLANVLANDVLSATATLPNPALNGNNAEVTANFTATNSGGTSLTYSGWAITLNGTTLHDGGNDISGIIPAGQPITTPWKGIVKQGV